MKTTRRGLFRLTSGAVALATFPSLSRASAPAPGRGGISLGHSLYGMQGVPLAEALGHCARIGYRNVELALDPGFAAEPKAFTKAARRNLRARLGSLGLSVSALMRNLRLIGGTLTPAQNLEAIKEAAEFAHDVAPGAPPPIETVLGGTPADWENSKARLADGLAAWAAAAEAADIELLIKAHAMMAVDTPEKLLWILARAPSPRLRVAFDYSHFGPQGIPLESSWKALGPLTKFVHVKDSRREDGKVVFLLPGDGTTDYPRLFRLLRRTGYAGPVVVEVSAMVFRQPGYDAVATAEKCYRFLSRALDEAAAPPA